MELDPGQYSEVDRREVDLPIQVDMPHGHQEARSIGGLKTGRNGAAGSGVQTVISDGSKPLIFVVLHRCERI
jgi:hypothetical protein